MAGVRFSPEAVSDLKQIKSYIAGEFSDPQAAEKTTADIIKRIRLLSELPRSGAPLSSITGIESDYRFVVSGSYTAFYRYENDTIFVVRILYGRRDFMRILFAE